MIGLKRRHIKDVVQIHIEEINVCNNIQNRV